MKPESSCSISWIAVNFGAGAGVPATGGTVLLLISFSSERSL
jgi:hypothetical protein